MRNGFLKKSPQRVHAQGLKNSRSCHGSLFWIKVVNTFMVCPTPQSCSRATITAIVPDLGIVRVLRGDAFQCGRATARCREAAG